MGQYFFMNAQPTFLSHNCFHIYELLTQNRFDIWKLSNSNRIQTHNHLVLKWILKAQFSYCPLVWMCHSRSMNNIINRLHERCLRIFYNDRGSFLEDLLGKDGSVTIHTRNLRALATEVFKVHNNMSRELIQGLLLCKTNSLWFEKSPSLFYLKYKFCLKLIPDRLKELNSTSSLKNEIKKWQPEICPGRLCKTYIPCVGFL